MKTFTLVLAIVFASVCTVDLQAGYILVVDLDASQGIQSNRTVNVGDLVTANFLMSSTENTDSLIAYNFHVRYNDTFLTFQTPRVETPGNLGGNFGTGSSNGKDTLGGFVRNLDGITQDSISGIINVPVQIASLTFRVAAPGISTINPGIFESRLNEWIDTNGINVATTVSFQGASITAVPEPGSIALLAVASAASAYGMRRKKRAVSC